MMYCIFIISADFETRGSMEVNEVQLISTQFLLKRILFKAQLLQFIQI